MPEPADDYSHDRGEGLPEGEFLLLIRFLREGNRDDWVVVDKFDPDRDERNYYEEVEVDHCTKDPFLKDLKKRIRLKPDKVQCQEM